jgi:hypothetical protein
MTQKRFPTGIMTTICVPWDDRGQVIESILRENVRHGLSGPHLILARLCLVFLSCALCLQVP